MIKTETVYVPWYDVATTTTQRRCAAQRDKTRGSRCVLRAARRLHVKTRRNVTRAQRRVRGNSRTISEPRRDTNNSIELNSLG